MSFGFSSIEHALAYVGQEIVTVSKKIASVAGKIQGSEQTVEALTSLVDPQAVLIERAAYQALGMVVGAANDTATAASANGLNVTADAQTIADYKALYAYLQSQAKAKGLSLTLPKP